MVTGMAGDSARFHLRSSLPLKTMYKDKDVKTWPEVQVCVHNLHFHLISTADRFFIERSYGGMSPRGIWSKGTIAEKESMGAWQSLSLYRL